MDYLGFDLRLGEWDPQAQQGIAEVLQSPAGESARYSFSLEVEIDAVAALTSLPTSVAVRLGRRMAVSVFSQQSLTLWYESYQVARERGRGLRLRLHIDSWELSRLPWELLYDSRRGDFIVFDPLISVVRYVRLYTPAPALRHGQHLKVLAVSAAPRGEAPLDWQREFTVLRQATASLSGDQSVEIGFLEHATQERLHQALGEQRPDVVHYVGHGGYDRASGQGLLLLEREGGEVAPLAAPEAARLLRRYGVNLVVLNACETAKGTWAGLGPALVRREIPAVVAMQWPVEDRAAIRFSELFYRSLAQGHTVDECVAEGRMGASAADGDPLSWGAPVLFLRSLSGRLWTDTTTGDGHQVHSDPHPANVTPTHAGHGDNGLYRTHGPLTATDDADLIVERPELRRVLRLAQQPLVSRYVAILSARQMGKTTLLLSLMDLLRSQCPCAFVDLSVLRGQTASDCYRYVASRLLRALTEAVHDARSLPREATPSSSVEFVEFLSTTARALPATRILVLLDEVGALAAEASDSFFNTLRTVFTQGRGLKGELSRYLFIFSGATDLYGLTYGANSPLNICEKVYLTELAKDDIVRLVGLFRNLGVTVPREAPERIYALTGGHPYLTMRICALLERARCKRLTPDQIEAAAEEIMVEDDNIHHLVRELDRRPAERRRLYGILVQGQQLPFSRNDPVLASLEMIGAVRPEQPCRVRNVLYERALRPYLQQVGPGDEPEGPPVAVSGTDADGWDRLAAMWPGVKGSPGGLIAGRAWQEFAETLFGRVPAFAAYHDVVTDSGRLGLVLGIDREAPGGAYWSAFDPAILVELADLSATPGKRIVAEALGKAEAHALRLAIMVTLRGRGRGATVSGARGERCIVSLDEEEIDILISTRGDLEALLRRKVLEARLRRI